MKYVFQLDIEGEDFARCPDDTLAAVWLLQRSGRQASAASVDNPEALAGMRADLVREIVRRWLETLAIYSDKLDAFERMAAMLASAPNQMLSYPTTPTEIKTTSDESLAMIWVLLRNRHKVSPPFLDMLTSEIADRWLSMLVLYPVEMAPGRWSRPSITENKGAAA